MGCTNSQIRVEKSSSGIFNSSYFVNDQTPGSASYSGNNAIMAFPLGLTNKALTNTTQYNPYIFITQERTLGTIDGGYDNGTIIQINSTDFSYNGTLSSGDVLIWSIVSLDGGTIYK